MAYQTGTATSERDLLNQLNSFLTTNDELVASGENWTQLYTRTIAATATQKEQIQIAWSAPGSSDNNQIYVGAMSDNSISSDIYNLFLVGGAYFNASSADVDFMNGFLNPSPRVGICCDASPFYYWFFVNGRRFIVVTKMNNIYSTAYCGFMLPTVTPPEYPYPLVIAGSINDTMYRYSIRTDYNTSIVDPRALNFWLMNPDQSWRDYYGSAATSTKTSGSSRHIYPRSLNRYSSNYGWAVFSKLAASPGEQYPLHYTTILSLETTGYNTLGVLDGVYCINGISRSAEDIFETADNRRFITFYNAFRVDVYDFFVIEMV